MKNQPVENNSFGLLRFLFAVFVLYHHTFILGGFGYEPIGKAISYQESFGSIAVIGFFVISGYLVTKSLVSSHSILAYFAKRFLRIYPGFWVCLIVTAFFIAPLVYFFEQQTLVGFFNLEDNGPFGYLISNFTTLIHRQNIALLLGRVPFPYVFNGSLWTLFLEVKAYIFLGVLAIFGIHKKKYLLLLIYLLLWVSTLFNLPIQNAENKFIRLLIDKDFLFFVTYFFAGSVYFLYRDKINYKLRYFWLSWLGVLIAAVTGILHQSLPLLAPYIILYLAFKLPIKKINKLGDYSYGLYIYAFPIQQLLSFMGLNTHILVYFTLALSITMILAMASWHWIEKPALALKAMAIPILHRGR